MSSTINPAPVGKSGRPLQTIELSVSTYDRAAGLLVAMLILVGFTTLVLFLLWLTNQMWIRNQTVEIVVEETSGRADHAEGVARDLEPPGVEELPDLNEPALADTLEAVTEAVSNQMATLEAMEGTGDLLGKGKGQGDSRRAGTGGDGDDIIPRWERWEIQFEGGTLNSYAAQLDYFKIELAMITKITNRIDYAFNLSKRQPDTRSGTTDTDKRLYMIWRGGRLRDADKALLAKAGINVGSNIMLQFYPKDTENLLAVAEKRQMGDRQLKEVQKTIFGVSPGPNYQFNVLSIRYRKVR